MLFINRIVYAGRNTMDSIHKLWKRIAPNSSLSISISQLSTALMQTSTPSTQKRLVGRLTFSGLRSQERTILLLYGLKKWIVLAVERGGVWPSSLLANNRIECRKWRTVRDFYRTNHRIPNNKQQFSYICRNFPWERCRTTPSLMRLEICISRSTECWTRLVSLSYRWREKERIDRLQLRSEKVPSLLSQIYTETVVEGKSACSGWGDRRIRRNILHW